jgi:transcriptional regulator with XRE-family HTH domain
MPGDGPATVARGFADNLRRVRRREGLSQEQLAKRGSLHRTEIGLLEAGGRSCWIDTLIRLAGAPAIRPDELLEGIHWVPGPDTRGTFTVSGSRPSGHARETESQLSDRVTRRGLGEQDPARQRVQKARSGRTTDTPAPRTAEPLTHWRTGQDPDPEIGS